ncbi:methylaspartate mutase, partial [Streptomyces sp. SID7909]|nr:methylaspartate mutase [Streptomyces sp. SID7909]
LGDGAADLDALCAFLAAPARVGA